MEHKQPGSPAMRVSIVSVSRNQREHLKRLIEQHGPRVVGMSGFRDYDLTRDEQHPDVLLVDLDQADDASLTRIERLLDQSNVPVLFNESTAVPTTPGPYRDDWVDNLVGKLYNLATHRSLLIKPGLSDRPRYAQTVGHALPNVLIVAHSKTRRRVLQNILAAQGIRDSTETSFEPNFIAERMVHYDALLVDEHNVSPEEHMVLTSLTAQARVPVQVCNSSKIPYAAVPRRTWGIQLAGKIIKISKLRPASPSPAVATVPPVNAPAYSPRHFVAVNGEHEWGSRLSEVLAQVRTNLTQQAAAAKVKLKKPALLNPSKTTTTALSTASNNASATSEDQPSLTTDQSIMAQFDARAIETRQNKATATLGIIATHQEIKGRQNQEKPSTRQVLSGVTTAPASVAAKKPNLVDPAPKSSPAPVRVKKALSASDIIDASNLDSLPVMPPPRSRHTPPIAPLPVDARDSEIERFFDFDKELDISQQRHALGEGHVLNSATHDEVVPWDAEKEQTNPFSKSSSARATKKQRSTSRDSLMSRIRKKLPKIFH